MATGNVLEYVQLRKSKRMTMGRRGLASASFDLLRMRFQ
jgi:hypothetical protein